MFVIVFTLAFLAWCIASIWAQIKDKDTETPPLYRPRTRLESDLEILGDYLLTLDEEQARDIWLD